MDRRNRLSSVNFFDMFDLLRNDLAGDTNIFIIGGFVIIWYLGLKFKMPFAINLLLAGLWAAIVYDVVANLTAWILLVLGGSFSFYYAIKDVFQIGK